MTYRNRDKRGRSLRWPLQSGLVTVVTLMGTQQTLITGCGLSVIDDKPAGRAPGTGTGGSPNGTGGSTSASSFTVSDAGFTVSKCEFDAGVDASIDASTAFADEAFSMAKPWPLVIYSWTTVDQVAELRSNSVLFSHSERTGLGRGLVFDKLASLASRSQNDSAALAKLIGEELFTTARFGWTNPWATRMGWPGEQYGDQLLRIELKPEAWIVYFDGNVVSVSDINHQNISIEQALATPERIGAIYFQNGPNSAGISCGGTFGVVHGSGGFREFVLGNGAMVKQWSLATADIQQKIESDIAKLKALRNLLEACPPYPYFELWNAEVVCSWFNSGGSGDGYIQSLALPSEFYYPTADNIATLIETLESDPFTLDPLVVDVSP